MSKFESTRGVIVSRTPSGDVRVGHFGSDLLTSNRAEAVAEFLEHEAAEKEAREARPWEFAEDGTVWRLVEASASSTYPPGIFALKVGRYMRFVSAYDHEKNSLDSIEVTSDLWKWELVAE